MKRFLSLILSFILVLTFALSVSADVIFEPEDEFYNSHRDECEHVERSFTATEDVKSFNKPNGKLAKCTFQKGDIISISYIYTDSSGIVWGVADYSENLGSSAEGWVPMKHLAVIYDNSSFLAEFESVITQDTEGLKLPETDKLVFWAYPGSENYYEMEPWDDGYLDIDFMHAYTDENGITWGYVGYFYGMRGWLRIDDPSSTTAQNVIEREPEIIYNISDSDIDIPENTGLSPIWLAVMLVSAACAVTAVLIVTLSRKKKD